MLKGFSNQPRNLTRFRKSGSHVLFLAVVVSFMSHVAMAQNGRVRAGTGTNFTQPNSGYQWASPPSPSRLKVNVNVPPPVNVRNDPPPVVDRGLRTGNVMRIADVQLNSPVYWPCGPESKWMIGRYSCDTFLTRLVDGAPGSTQVSFTDYLKMRLNGNPKIQEPNGFLKTGSFLVNGRPQYVFGRPKKVCLALKTKFTDCRIDNLADDPDCGEPLPTEVVVLHRNHVNFAVDFSSTGNSKAVNQLGAGLYVYSFANLFNSSFRNAIKNNQLAVTNEACAIPAVQFVEKLVEFQQKMITELKVHEGCALKDNPPEDCVAAAQLDAAVQGLSTYFLSFAACEMEVSTLKLVLAARDNVYASIVNGNSALHKRINECRDELPVQYRGTDKNFSNHYTQLSPLSEVQRQLAQRCVTRKFVENISQVFTTMFPQASEGCPSG